MITEPSQFQLNEIRNQHHGNCLLCGRANVQGLALDFDIADDGSITTEFSCAEHLQGYSGILHGGMTSSLLDCAMTNCLFAHGIVAVTAEINVRFRHPIFLDTPLTISAKISDVQGGLYIIDSFILQKNQLKAQGSGKFMKKRF